MTRKTKAKLVSAKYVLAARQSLGVNECQFAKMINDTIKTRIVREWEAGERMTYPKTQHAIHKLAPEVVPEAPWYEESYNLMLDGKIVFTGTRTQVAREMGIKPISVHDYAEKLKRRRKKAAAGKLADSYIYTDYTAERVDE